MASGTSSEAAQRALDLALEVDTWRGPGCIVCGRTDLRLRRESRSGKRLCQSCWSAKGHYWRDIVAMRFR